MTINQELKAPKLSKNYTDSLAEILIFLTKCIFVIIALVWSMTYKAVSLIVYYATDFLHPINRKGKITVKEIKDGISFATVDGMPIILNPNFIFRHTLITGETGAGKSWLLGDLALQINRQGTQILLLDPHGKGTEYGDSKTAPRTVVDSALLNIYNRMSKKEQEKTKILSVFHRPVRGANNLTDEVYCGFNPLFTLDKTPANILKQATAVKSVLYNNAIQDNQKAIMHGAGVLIESAMTANACYIDYLQSTGKGKDEIVEILKTRQVTVNDLYFNAKQVGLWQFMSEMLQDIRPDLAKIWREMLEKEKVDHSIQLASSTLSDTLENVNTQLFLESRGFEPIAYLQQGFNVLCDTSGLHANVQGIIGNYALGELWNLVYNSKLNNLWCCVDEAKVLNLPDGADIIDQARKYKLGLCLSMQRTNQMRAGSYKDAVTGGVATTIQYKNKEGASEEKGLLEREVLVKSSDTNFERVLRERKAQAVSVLQAQGKEVDYKKLDEQFSKLKMKVNRVQALEQAKPRTEWKWVSDFVIGDKQNDILARILAKRGDFYAFFMEV